MDELFSVILTRSITFKNLVKNSESTFQLIENEKKVLGPTSTLQGILSVYLTAVSDSQPVQELTNLSPHRYPLSVTRSYPEDVDLGNNYTSNVSLWLM